MAALVGISPHRLWCERNLQTTIQCRQLSKTYRRFWTTEAGWAPHDEQTVRRHNREGVSSEGTLHQTFDPCLSCIASFTTHATKQFPVDHSRSLQKNYEPSNNNVKSLMRVNQDRVHMLSPHACVVRRRCSCSGTPQSHHYMIPSWCQKVAYDAAAQGRHRVISMLRSRTSATSGIFPTPP
jgi:hypothetical protein